MIRFVLSLLAAVSHAAVTNLIGSSTTVSGSVSPWGPTFALSKLADDNSNSYFMSLTNSIGVLL